MQVADFGMSRRIKNKSVHTVTYGTATHMPPELLMHGTLTTAVDVYAFGDPPHPPTSPIGTNHCMLGSLAFE